MTPDLAAALLLSVVSALGPFRGVRCTENQVQRMELLVRANPGLPATGIITLVKRTCKK